MSQPLNLLLNKGLQPGMATINAVDISKFTLILNRIAQCIQARSEDLRPFSEEEEEKLTETLAISRSDLTVMLDTSLYLMKQAAFNLTKPAVFKQQLSEQLKLNDDKVDAFVSVWSNQAKDIVTGIKQKSLYSKQVESVSWMLNTVVSSSREGAVMEPRAIVEMKLQNTDEPSGNLRLDLNQTQLQELYKTLETVQTQLDSLRCLQEVNCVINNFVNILRE